MSKKTVKTALSFILTLLLTVSAIPADAAGGGEKLYSNTMLLHEGLSFTDSIWTNSSGKRVEEYTLELDAGGPVYPIVLAKDKVHNAMDLNGMTAWAESHGYNVHGAINADFFYETNGYPLGGVIQNGEYVSSVNGENMLAFTEDGAFFSEKPTVGLRLENLGGGDGENAGKTVEVEHLNKIRTKTGGLFLYTGAYADESTCTTRPGWGVIFKILDGGLTVNGTVELQVEKVIPSGEDYPLDDEHMVLTCPADNPKYAEQYKSFAVGDRVTLTTECSDERLTDAVWACGCGDMLAFEGELTDKESWDKDLIKENPRTCVGIKADGSVIACVVDGRQESYSNGALLEEVAADLIARGCETVVNLDGGGSSAMSVRLPGKDSCAIVNRPSGKLRNCGDYILFVSDAESDGVADMLHIEEDGAFVLTGSSIPVNVTATDSAGMPAEFTESFYADCSYGELYEGFYTAGDTAGVDELRLYAYTSDAAGVGSIHVIDRLDTLTVVDDATGKAPDLAQIEAGDEIWLTVSGTRLTRDVAISTSSVSFSATGDAGQITEDGLFTATGAPGSTGEISVSAGGIEVTIPVGVKLRFSDTVGHWAEEYIDDLFDKGVVDGTGNMEYKPDDNIGRCDFVLMLWRTLGSPVLESSCPFADVDPASYYYDAVVWGSSIGLVNGVGGDRFDPRGVLTREQAFTIIHRLLTLMGKELPEPDESALDIFADADGISAFAVEPMSSLTAFGMIAGSGGSCFPKRDTTRGEVAKIIVLALY